MIEINKDTYLKMVCDALNNIELQNFKAIYAVDCIKNHAQGNRLPFFKFKRIKPTVKPYTVTVYREAHSKIKNIYNSLKYHVPDTILVSYDDVNMIESWVTFEGWLDWVIEDYINQLKKQYFSFNVPSKESIEGYIEGNMCNYEKEEYYEKAKKSDTPQEV